MAPVSETCRSSGAPSQLRLGPPRGPELVRRFPLGCRDRTETRNRRAIDHADRRNRLDRPRTVADRWSASRPWRCRPRSESNNGHEPGRNVGARRLLRRLVAALVEADHRRQPYVRSGSSTLDLIVRRQHRLHNDLAAGPRRLSIVADPALWTSDRTSAIRRQRPHHVDRPETRAMRRFRSLGSCSELPIASPRRPSLARQPVDEFARRRFNRTRQTGADWHTTAGGRSATDRVTGGHDAIVVGASAEALVASPTPTHLHARYPWFDREATTGNPPASSAPAPGTDGGGAAAPSVSRTVSRTQQF